MRRFEYDISYSTWIYSNCKMFLIKPTCRATHLVWQNEAQSATKRLPEGLSDWKFSCMQSLNCWCSLNSLVFRNLIIKLLTPSDIFRTRNHLSDYYFCQWILFDIRNVRHVCHKRDFSLLSFSILHTLEILLDNSFCRCCISLAIYWLRQQKYRAVREDT